MHAFLFFPCKCLALMTEERLMLHCETHQSNVFVREMNLPQRMTDVEIDYLWRDMTNSFHNEAKAAERRHW